MIQATRDFPSEKPGHHSLHYLHNILSFGILEWRLQHLFLNWIFCDKTGVPCGLGALPHCYDDRIALTVERSFANIIKTYKYSRWRVSPSLPFATPYTGPDWRWHSVFLWGIWRILDGSCPFLTRYSSPSCKVREPLKTLPLKSFVNASAIALKTN
jgi:hypothetical protein